MQCLNTERYLVFYPAPPRNLFSNRNSFALGFPFYRRKAGFIEDKWVEIVYFFILKNQPASPEFRKCWFSGSIAEIILSVILPTREVDALLVFIPAEASVIVTRPTPLKTTRGPLAVQTGERLSHWNEHTPVSFECQGCKCLVDESVICMVHFAATVVA